MMSIQAGLVVIAQYTHYSQSLSLLLTPYRNQCRQRWLPPPHPIFPHYQPIQHNSKADIDHW